MKSIIYYYKFFFIFILTAVIALNLIGCQDDDLLDGQGLPTNGDGLVVTTSPTRTRADEGHIDTSDPFAAGSEDLIRSAELYFFSDAMSPDKAIYHCHVGNINKVGLANIKLKLPLDKLSDFGNSPDDPNKRIAYVYALVNMPEGTELPVDDDATLENLKDIWVSTDDFGRKAIPADFVMRGGNIVTLEGEGQQTLVKGCIPVERLAAKIRLFANIQDVIYLDESGKAIPKPEGWSDEQFKNTRPEGTVEEWRPLPNSGAGSQQTPNTWLFMTNYTKRAQISGGITDNDEDYGSIERITTRNSQGRNMIEGVNIYDYSDLSSTQPVDREKYPYTHELAYYSYPNKWDSSTILEEHASSVTMRLTWTRVWDKDTQGNNQLFGNFYYQIPVNRIKGESGFKEDCIQPNMYYRIKVDIGMLGNKELGTPLIIDGSYEVLPWINEPIDVNINGRRYLVVNETDWTMNNTSFISIPFSTSHPVELEYCYVNYFRYNEKWGTDYDSEECTYDNDGNPSWKGTYEHNSDEFKKWLDSAYAEGLIGGDHTSEGRITAKVDSRLPSFSRLLYYKDSYFYDAVYDTLKRRDHKATTMPYGYKYYVGHEKPYTFQHDYVTGADYTVKPKNITLQGDIARGWELFEQIYQTDTIYTCKVNNKDRLITFSNPLVLWKDTIHQGQFMYYPERTKAGKLRDQFSRIEITIKIRHSDWKENDLFSEIIHITQYPGMYIEVSHDYGDPIYRHNDTGTSREKQTLFNQYVIVNGHKSTSNKGDAEWNSAIDYQMASFAGNNCNPNMYVIHTTQLSEDNPNYIIGDPRSLYYENMLEGAAGRLPGNQRYNEFLEITGNVELGLTEATILGSKNYRQKFNWIGFGRYATEMIGLAPNYYYYENLASVRNVGSPGWRTSPPVQMKRYYPTDETGGPGTKENFIAPVFRIASSFGKVKQNYLEPGRRRCAVYQEAGRPAGRWRLPTKSEIEYIATLSADGKIPILFGNSEAPSDYGNYWSANGKVRVNAKGDVQFLGKGGSGDGNYSPRCVYDEWYWTIVDEAADYHPWARETNFLWGDIYKDNTQMKIRSLWRR